MIWNIFIVSVLIYLLWALLHHKRDRSLTLPILLEYLLTVVLVLILVMGVKF